MPLQSDNLIMVGLGVLGDVPPHPIQPTLPNGIHLRWQPGDGIDFPWHGYFLFRRPHNDGQPICIASTFDPAWPVGFLGNYQMQAALPDGVLSSDTALRLTEGFLAAGAREFDLRNRNHLLFALPAGRYARRFEITLGFGPGGGGEPGDPEDEDPKDPKGDDSKEEDPKEEDPKEEEIPGDGGLGENAGCLGGFLRPFGRVIGTWLQPRPVTPGQTTGSGAGSGATPAGPAASLMIWGYDDGVWVQIASASGSPGQRVKVSLEADRMDSVKIMGGDAVLIDICYVPVDQGWNVGWAVIPGFVYPMCLPTAKAGYPCPGRPATDGAAEALALQRVRYGLSAPWSGPPVQDLREAMDGMVANGPPPFGLPMVDRTGTYSDATDPDAPTMPDQRPYDLIMLGAINPAIAQMAGLYYIDDPEPQATGPSAGAYDYLLLADHAGLYQGQASVALAALANPLPANVDGWICYGLRKKSAAPLPVPTELKAFALPGAATNPALIAADKIHAAGLHWKIEETPDGDLLPGAHVGYHVWRAGPIAQPNAAVAPSAHTHITANRMVMVSVPETGPAVQQYASDWPQMPLHKVDTELQEGWYAYLARGMDIFGRISGPSAPASWRQWGPEPSPRPWYYANPVGDREVNPWAVRLLCKTPPPAVPGVQAWTLDPLDPGLEDGPNGIYHAWRALGWWNNLAAADKPRKAGLKVRWLWNAEQMLAAPRTREFRIYVSPGTNPVAGYENPLNWPARFYVVDYTANFTNVVDLSTNTVVGRQYEVLLPHDAASSDFPDLIMEPTDADPVVYANVAVTAADDRTHTLDDAKWAVGVWGGSLRFGNEGPIGSTAKITRVLRSPPPAPPLIGADDKVWATEADYHGISRYTVHWARPATPSQKVHIFRAVDDALFRHDWERRRVAGAHVFTTTDVDPFAVAGGWDNAADKAFVADQLTDLDTVKTLDFDADPAVRAAYDGLGERALRVLASLPDNAEAFVQTTWEPLDPAVAENADRAGPDGLPTYVPNSNWGAWVAELDGRASNRYFFRAAYVNSAHDVGPMGPSSPAVYLHKVEPPRRVAITRVASGQLEITVAWYHNREPDFAEFRLYRADDERQARDRRLMRMLTTIAKADVDYAMPEVSFTDADGLVGGRTYRYVLTSVDAKGNESLGSEAAAMAVDSAPPIAPFWLEQTWLVERASDLALLPWPGDGVVPANHAPVLRLGWMTEIPEPRFRVSRRQENDANWRLQSGAQSPDPAGGNTFGFVWLDRTADPGLVRGYRIRVSGSSGLWSQDRELIVSRPLWVEAV